MAATAVPNEIEESLRRKLRSVFGGEPKKFKHGRLEGARKAIALIAGSRVPIAVVEVHIG